MDKVNKKKHEGGVRKYLRRTLRQRILQIWNSRHLGACDNTVFLDTNVKFLRHPERIRIDPHVIIKDGARLCVTNPDAELQIGTWTTIGYHTFVFANARIRIGANCLIAPFCYLVDTNHGFKKERLIREQPMTSSPILIEDDVWLGQGVTVLSGVKIGKGSVVAAGSVVITSCPPYSVLSGNPARVIDRRR